MNHSHLMPLCYIVKTDVLFYVMTPNILSSSPSLLNLIHFLSGSFASNHTTADRFMNFRCLMNYSLIHHLFCSLPYDRPIHCLKAVPHRARSSSSYSSHQYPFFSSGYPLASYFFLFFFPSLLYFLPFLLQQCVLHGGSCARCDQSS